MILVIYILDRSCFLSDTDQYFNYYHFNVKTFVISSYRFPRNPISDSLDGVKISVDNQFAATDEPPRILPLQLFMRVMTKTYLLIPLTSQELSIYTSSARSVTQDLNFLRSKFGFISWNARNSSVAANRLLTESGISYCDTTNCYTTRWFLWYIITINILNVK